MSDELDALMAKQKEYEARVAACTHDFRTPRFADESGRQCAICGVCEVPWLRNELSAARVTLSRISGVLCDAGDVPVEPYPEAVQMLLDQRNAARAATLTAEDLDALSLVLSELTAPWREEAGGRTQIMLGFPQCKLHVREALHRLAPIVRAAAQKARGTSPELTESETVRRIVEWLRSAPIVTGLTHRNCADAIERGDWKRGAR